MADFTTTHLPGRRRPGTGVIPLDTSHGSSERKTEVDRAQEYDRALRQSQLAARRRGGSMLGASTLGVPGPSGSSIFEGLSTAQTAVLGDSQGSVQAETVHEVSKITDSDLAEDGGVGSGLGESYVDGAKRTRAFGEAEEEEDGLEDGGVLGLLAQIYDRRDGPTRVL